MKKIAICLGTVLLLAGCQPTPSGPSAFLKNTPEAEAAKALSAQKRAECMTKKTSTVTAHQICLNKADEIADVAYVGLGDVFALRRAQMLIAAQQADKGQLTLLQYQERTIQISTQAIEAINKRLGIRL